MSDEDDHIARYQRPPRKGQFKPGQSGNPRSRPKGSKNIRTYVNEHLNKKIRSSKGAKRERLRGPRRLRSSLSTRPPKGSLKALPPS